MTRDELRLEINVALVELKDVAQPYELATFREMLVEIDDVEDAQLEAFGEEVRNLKSFCERRKNSDANYRIDLLPRGRPMSDKK